HSAGLLAAVSIRQQYAGHAKQAVLALVNSGPIRPRYAIVVDDDVNIRDLEELMWAICTRTDPVRDSQIITRYATNELDPAIPPWGNNFQSREIIDATRPWEWRDQFPKSVDVSPDLWQAV